MKILFVSYSPIAMDVTMPEREPLGGSEFCVAYLARQLAQNGHDVTFAARLPCATPGQLLGVRHVPLAYLDEMPFFAREEFDAVVTLSAPAAADYLKAAAPQAFHVCWLHLLPGQSAMAPLAAMTPMIDCAVFVSRTQRDMTPYDGACAVIGNGIAPAFEDMFASAEELHAAKENRAAYTSMPYRGLDVLSQVIRLTTARTEFDVYSAMKTYRVPDTPFAGLYQSLRTLPRVHYHGAIAQPALAARLRNAAFLAYPCTFVETYCIAALEAMAAGLQVVSIERGALTETTLGLAQLLPLAAETTAADIAVAYTALLEKNVAEFLAQPVEWAARRFEQVQTVNRVCSWRARAAQWEQLLGPAIAAKRAAR